MKKILMIAISFAFVLNAQQNPYQRVHDQYNLKKNIETLEKTAEALMSLHDCLTRNSAEVNKLNMEAAKKINDELYEAYVEASMNLVDKIYTPFSSALDITVDVIKNLVLEDPIWKGSQRKTQFTELKNSTDYRNTKLRIMYATLSKVSDQPLARFDDDQKPLPFTKSWWRIGDNKEDDQLELRIRKLNILKNLSKLVYEKTEQELVKIRTERRMVLEELASVKAESEAREIQNRKSSENENTLSSRLLKSRGYIGKNDRGENVQLPGPRELIESKYPNDPPELKAEINKYNQAKTEAEAKDLALNEERKRLFEERKARLADATVYIDSDCSRYVYPGEKVLMLAKAHPEDVEGTFTITVDDARVGGSREKSNFYSFYYTFTKPGVYDVQVHLYDGPNRIDTYTDQWYVEDIMPAAQTNSPFPTFAKDNRPKYDSSLEGTIKPVLQNQYVNYSLLYSSGDIYLTGYYYTPAGEKVNYKSKPLAAALEMAPAAGLMLTKGGTGYHFYQTTGETSDGTPYIITRLRGTEITVLHEFKATFINVKNAPDYSSYTVEYRMTGNGSLKTFTLD
ncbi:MAG: hypothetical protein KKA84_13790 [Bacteroidetes bacterium]|nr:hypothetical protein [Bacteroidota bacterium]